MKLLPKDLEHGWAPYVWLAYFVFFFLHPILDRVGWKEWLATGLGSGAFLVLYFVVFWLRRPRKLLPIAGMVLLGVGFARWNPGASSFFIYAAALLPFVVETEVAAAGLLGIILAIIGMESWVLHLRTDFWLPAAFFSLFIGLGNIYFAERNRHNQKLRRAQDEIEHLVKVAERERIARDLHDVLGHTLSVVVLKAELAGKLVERDAQRAKAEIEEVENISREALAEVRNAIGGYRAGGLAEELYRAKAILATAGVKARCESAAIPLTAAQENVLALVMREAVTNVVRHARAQNCSVQVSQNSGDCLCTIVDDGQGGTLSEGNGLRGMRERVEALGGTLQRDSSAGTALTIRFPLRPEKKDD